MDKENRIKEIEKEFLKVAIVDLPGTVLVGLGLYAKFAANGAAFHPLLNDQSVVNGMLALGGAILVWAVHKMVSLVREKASLANSV